MDLKAREKTTQIRQTLDAIGVDLAHKVADGNVEVTNAVWAVVSVHDADGKVLYAYQQSIAPMSTVVRVPDLLGRHL